MCVCVHVIVSVCVCVCGYYLPEHLRSSLSVVPRTVREHGFPEG